MIVASRVPLTILLDALTDNLDLWCHLYVNDCAPNRYSTKKDFEEAAWGTYLAQQISTWTPAVLNNGHAVSQADPMVWRRGPVGDAVRVFGYFVTSGENGAYVYAERASQANGIDMSNDGQVVTVWPQLTLRSEFDPMPMLCGGVLVGGS